MRRLVAKIYGDVQGIGFRFSAKRCADGLGLKGFVRNESDGAVYLEAEGEEDNLEKLLDWCRDTFDLKLVKKVDAHFSDNISGYNNFLIE